MWQESSERGFQQQLKRCPKLSESLEQSDTDLVGRIGGIRAGATVRILLVMFSLMVVWTVTSARLVLFAFDHPSDTAWTIPIILVLYILTFVAMQTYIRQNRWLASTTSLHQSAAEAHSGSAHR